MNTQRYITKCGCPGDRVIDLENVVAIQRCARCGGIAGTQHGSVYQIGALMQAMKKDLHRLLGEIVPPGRARLARCSDCEGAGCTSCEDTGARVWNACIQHDCDGVIITCLSHGACLPPGQALGCPAFHELLCVKCRFLWTADDPRWAAQRLPETMLRHAPAQS